MRNEMSILSYLAILIRIAYQIRLYRFSVRKARKENRNEVRFLSNLAF